MWEFLSGKTILITGGTGSFGRTFAELALRHGKVAKLIILSRDELKQAEMARRFQHHEHIRFFLGDVRDPDRLRRAFQGVDMVVHTAALKQVPAGEYNPFEVIKTNILGAQHVIDAAIDQGVERVVALSTDKAANPVNLYGATKLCADKLFVAGNSYAGAGGTRFGVVRYGNVIGSRGSVIPLFYERRHTGVVPITDPRMTRFWITLEQGSRFVLRCLSLMRGGEIFVPKIPSMRLVDLAKVLAPGCDLEVIGIRPGEKVHEVMITEEDARRTLEFDDFYIIQPNFPWWTREKWQGGKPVPEGFRYGSDTNGWWLTAAELGKMLEAFQMDHPFPQGAPGP